MFTGCLCSKWFTIITVQKRKYSQGFFYETYQIKGFITKRNKNVGCLIVIVELKRSWEME